MLKNESRKGWSLGAIVALLFSLFGGVVPAANADANSAVVSPTKGSSYTMLVTEEFGLKFALGAAVADSNWSKLKVQIEKPAGYAVSWSFTPDVSSTSAVGAGNSSSAVAGDATVSVIAVADYLRDQRLAQLVVQPHSASSGITSVSAAVDVVVTWFIDTDANDVLDTDLESYQTQTVKFVPWATAFAGTKATFTAVNQDDTWATVSATIAGPVNLYQLNGHFFTILNSSEQPRVDGGFQRWSSSFTAKDARDGDLDFSSTSPFALGATASMTASVTITYNGSGNDSDLWDDQLTTTAITVGSKTYDDVTVSPTIGDNAAHKSEGQIWVRPNSTFEAEIYAYTDSFDLVKGQSPTFTITTDQSLNDERYVVVNGKVYTDEDDMPTESALAVPSSGEISVKTVGFDADATITLSAQLTNETGVYTFITADPSYTLEGDTTFLTVNRGQAFSSDWTVEDQWGKLTSRTNFRVVAVWVEDNVSASATSSATTNVVGGKATVTVPGSKPAAASGSAVVKVSLQQKNEDSGLWSVYNDQRADIAVTVTDEANDFENAPTPSVSASISYVASTGYSWSANVVGTINNPGGTVKVSSTDVIFRDADGDTASGTITIVADGNGDYTFSMAALKTGTYTISLVAGTTTTTSQLVVDAAAYNSGELVTFDTLTITPGSTATITGTLTDINGNAVETGDTASIKVTYVGKGLLIGSVPTSTDEDGKFALSFLAGALDTGVGAITVVYSNEGDDTRTKDKVTSVHVLNITNATSTPTSEQKLTVGSFKGYVAIYAKGYEGSKLSAKVAGKWLVVEELSAFQRTVRLTGAGYTIKVDLYIDGQFVRSETVVTK
jgi:hypothetical protein